MLHGHGDDIYSQSQQVKMNFSSNVPQLDNIDALKDFWSEKLHMLSSYPEANATSFVTMLADTYSLKTSQIVATHGATEAIYLMAQLFSGNTSVILQPTFSEYADACRIYKHTLSHVTDFGSLQDIDSELIWLCNPNNPTGKVLPYEELLQWIDSKPQTIFIVDQTYRYFTHKQTLSYQDAVSRKNLILIDSFTKRYVVPGLRLGYMVAHESLIKRITEIKPPWSVNQLAIETGKLLLQDEALCPLDLSQLLEHTRQLQDALSNLPGVKVYPTDTHFFLCELKHITAQALKKRLMEKYGILIRNADNFYGLNKHFIRIATQSKAHNHQLFTAIKEVLDEC